jgi:hypothetical protein
MKIISKEEFFKILFPKIILIGIFIMLIFPITILEIIFTIIWISIIMIFQEILEKFLLKNITIITFMLIILCVFFPEKLINNKENYIIIWAIFIFWYWYKKYERNKEIELIDKYYEKHKNIYNVFLNKKDIPNDEYFNLIELWKQEFFFYKKWYINNYLWDRWSAKIWIILRKHPIIITKLTYANNEEYNDFNSYIIWRLEFEINIIKEIQKNSEIKVELDIKEMEKFLKWGKDVIKTTNNNF